MGLGYTYEEAHGAASHPGDQVGLGLPRFWPNKLTDQLEVQPTIPLRRIPTPQPDGPANHSSFTHASTAPGSRATRRLMHGASARLASRTFAFCSRYPSSPSCRAARSRRREPMHDAGAASGREASKSCRALSPQGQKSQAMKPSPSFSCFGMQTASVNSVFNWCVRWHCC